MSNLQSAPVTKSGSCDDQARVLVQCMVLEHDVPLVHQPVHVCSQQRDVPRILRSNQRRPKSNLDGSITVCHVLPSEVPRGLVGRKVVLAPGADYPPPFLRRVLVTLQCDPAQRVQPSQRVVLELPVAVAVGVGLPVRCITGPVGMRREAKCPYLHELGELLAFRRTAIHGAECLALGDPYVEVLRRSDCLSRHVRPPMWENFRSAHAVREICIVTARVYPRGYTAV